MYEPGTILELKEQRPDLEIPAREDPDSGRKRPRQKLPFPYNRVEVINESPVQHDTTGGWSGSGARGVLIKPLSGFDANLDEPFGKLQKLYKVVSIPTKEIEVAPIRVINAQTAAAGPTPEEVFAEKAPGTPPKEGQIRGRSPLGDVANETNKSPLD